MKTKTEANTNKIEMIIIHKKKKNRKENNDKYNSKENMKKNVRHGLTCTQMTRL